MTHTTSKQELFVKLVTTVNYCLKEIYYRYYWELFVTLVTTVNYCLKEIYCRYYWDPRYVSETSYYQKFEMRNCKIMLKVTKI